MASPTAAGPDAGHGHSIHRSRRQLPCQHPARLDRLTSIRLSRPCPCFDDRYRVGEIHQSVAADQQTKTLLIEPGERPVGIAAEQIVQSPSERRCPLCKSAVEKAASIINELLPTLGRHIGWRAIGIEPNIAFGPFTRNATVMLNDLSAFV